MSHGRTRALALALGVVLGLASPVFARSVTLAWDPNPESDIGGYIVYRGQTCGPYTSSADAGNKTSYTFTSLPDGESHCFVVQAYNLAGERGPFSDPVSLAAGEGSSKPMMYLDEPPAFAKVSQPFIIAGWAADLAAGSGAGVSALHIYAYPKSGPPVFLGAATIGFGRPDVAAALGSTKYSNSGFGLAVWNLAPGDYTLIVYALSTVTGTFNNVVIRPVTVLAAPLMTIDSPAAGQTVSQPFVIDGWTIDPAAPSGTGIDAVNAFAYPNPGSGAPPIFVGWANYGGARPDVAAAYGARFLPSRFQVAVDGLPPGTYMLEIYVHSTATNRFSVAQQRLVNVKGRPRMSIDTPADQSIVGSSFFFIQGWALDLESTSGPGIEAVHAYAYPVSGGEPIFLGAATIGLSRPDVADAFGSTKFLNSGFSMIVTGLRRGTYDLVVYTKSKVTGTFNNVQIRRVTVP